MLSRHGEPASPFATVAVTGADIYSAACIAGLGLVQMPRYRVADCPADGRCLRLSPTLAQA